MSSIAENIQTLQKSLPEQITLVAVSKTKPIADLQEAYDAGQRVFGENKIQEMTEKSEVLSKDIEWHMIGHVQTNKVKYMASYVHLIHAVDSLKLLKEINKQAKKHGRIINCLLQLRIAQEETKFGLTQVDLTAILQSEAIHTLKNIKITGLMGMASFTEDKNQVEKEFDFLKEAFDSLKEKPLELKNCDLQTLSMGMSGDYSVAIECGSTMIRVGSAIFGVRK